MLNLKAIHPLVFLVIATTLEVNGDALLRTAMFDQTGMLRAGTMLLGALLLFGYGFTLNLAPLHFGQVVGLYIATLFIVWQITNFFAFKTVPTLPIIVGGLLIIMGGAIVTFWKTP